MTVPIKRTILLVEDNSDNRVIMRAVLEHAGYVVLVANDGPASIELAAEGLPDVILMDVALPGINGWDAAALIKANGSTSAIPIIAMTALAMTEDYARAAEIGMEGFLAKPVSLARVLSEVERVLGTRELM
jgi:CheY-like chemotaxis protein